LKTFHPDVLPQLYNVADFGRAMFSIPLKNGDNLDVKLLASPFQEEERADAAAVSRRPARL
jgi:hypothetical protein